MHHPEHAHLALGVFLIFCFIIFVIGYIVLIFFTYSLFKCLKTVKEENQAMTPGLVWLNLIPFFGGIWIFVIIFKIRESLSKEFLQNNPEPSGDYGLKVGLTFAILHWFGFVPMIGYVLVIISIICWLIYWFKISKYTRMINQGPDLLTTANNN